MTAQEIRECYLKPTVEFLIQSSQNLPSYFTELGCNVCNGRNLECPGYYPDESIEPMIYTEKLKQIREAASSPAPETRKRRRADLDLVALLRSFL